MADLKKLAMGRKGFQKGVGKGDPLKAEKGSDKTPSPLKPAKSLEESCADEIGEVEATFRAKIAKEDKRKVAATDSENWFCVYFATREAKDRFLRDHGLARIGDKYLDGRAVNRAFKAQGAQRARDSHNERR